MTVEPFYKPFCSAVRHLVGLGDLKSRLTAVFVFDFLKLQSEQVPSEIEEEYSVIKQVFARSEEFGDNNQIEKYINNLPDSELIELTEKICDLFIKIIELDAIEGFKIDNQLN